MKILNTATEEVVYVAWLQSELYKHKVSLSETDIQIIENPDLDSPLENMRRKQVLYSLKKPVMSELPESIRWYEVELHESDFPNLYTPVQPSKWSAVTGNTYQLSAMKPYVEDAIADPDTLHTSAAPSAIKDRVQKIVTKGNHPASQTDPLVIVSTSCLGPFTILDGTQRSAYLLSKGLLTGRSGYLGRSEEIVNFPLSIERLFGD